MLGVEPARFALLLGAALTVSQTMQALRRAMVPAAIQLINASGSMCPGSATPSKEVAPGTRGLTEAGCPNQVLGPRWQAISV